MDAIYDFVDQYVGDFLMKHAKRLIIFFFTMMIGMIIGVRFASAQTTTRQSPTPSPVVSKAPVPIHIGTVSEITATNVSITDEENQTQSYKLATTTRYEAPGITSIRGKPTAKNIAINDRIAIATTDESQATLIVIAGKGAAPTSNKQAFFGLVSSREATTSGTILSLKHPSEDEFAKASVTNATRVTAKDIDKATVDTIKAGDKVLVLGTLSARDIIAAVRVHVLPGKARTFLDKSATSTAKQSTAAGTKASPTPKP